MPLNPIPDGYHTVTPALRAEGAARLIEFVQQAFGVTEIERYAREDGIIMHAAVRIGDSIIEIGDAHDQWGPLQAAMHVYVAGTDASYARALEAGAVSLDAPMDQFYGERSVAVADPAGNHWYSATRTEDVSAAELEGRSAEFMRQQDDA